MKFKKKILMKREALGLLILVNSISLTSVSASNSKIAYADGFGGFVALFSIGLLAFMAPRLRRESLEENK